MTFDPVAMGKRGGQASGAARRAKREHTPRAESQTIPASEPASKPGTNGEARPSAAPQASGVLSRGRLTISAEVYARAWELAFVLAAQQRGLHWRLLPGEALVQGKLTKQVIDEYDWLQKTVGKLVEQHGAIGMLAVSTFQLVSMRMVEDEFRRAARETAYRGHRPVPSGAPPIVPSKDTGPPAGGSPITFEQPVTAPPGAASAAAENALGSDGELGDRNQASDHPGGSGSALPDAVTAQYEGFYKGVGTH